MAKYTEDAKALLEYVGGKENIQAVTHCVTRMRFVLFDEKKADVERIEDIPSAKGTFTQSGQFQVIIGNDVQSFYNEFIKVSGIEGVSKEALKSEAKTNQTALQKIIGTLGEIFAPIIPALICGGLILGFRNVIDSIQFFDNGTKTLVQISQFWNGVDSFLWLIGEAVFHFLPVTIVWSITKKMGTSQGLGIILGITLVSPQLLNAYAVASTPAAKIPVWDFGFATVQMIGYQGQVIPAMLAGFVLVYLERFWRKVSPNAISMIVVPFFSIVPAVLIAHTVVGPIGWIIGNFISDVVWAGLTSPFRWLFAGVFGFVYAPLVITGLHHMTNAIDTQLTATFGGTLLWPMIALSNIAQGSSVLAMTVLQKNNEKAKEINIPSCISCYLGVTEPALFGVNLKYTFPFFYGMIGSACAAIFSVSTGTMAASIGVGGIPGILSIIPKYMPTFAIAMLIAIIIPFTLTYILGKKKLNEVDFNGKVKPVNEVFHSPLKGKVIPLNEVEDQVFSQGLMGEGFAVELTDGEVKAPFTGEVVMTYPTKHAYGLLSDDGTEILIHLGMDTVELNGEGFECLVEKGQRVKQGQTIAKVNLDYVKEHGKSLVSPVVFTSHQHIELKDVKETDNNQEIIEIK
ncbi:PTS system trehalose-specific EIIBC component [uncultured Catenibacterium sp.]|uniref:PTS system trehalose-specific EIIBC component n=1 Tax=uncultured Catenibacterium sp. TaxID=286142 RepID=UPI0025CD3FED|nr:PTS system trehalose-specific EIIBC component [uncultured Catenibacterium sp.]